MANYKNKLWAMLLGGIAFSTYAGAQENTVRMSTERPAGSKVTMMVNSCRGGVSVDWGDGKPEEYKSDNGGSLVVLEGTVRGKDITISGKNDWYMLDCSDCGITEIDLAQGKELRSLFCDHNKLERLELKEMRKLVDLDCSDNLITELVFTNQGLPANDLPAIMHLDISNNRFKGRYHMPLGTLQQLNASNNDFETFYVFDKGLRTLNVSGNRIKNTLNFKSSPDFGALNCSGNNIAGVSFHNGGQNMRQVVCSDNAIRNMDLTQAAGLTDLCCDGNRLTEMNVSKDAHISVLDMSGNALTFSVLPAYRDKPDYLFFDPQAPFDMSQAEGMLAAEGKPYAPVTDWNSRYKQTVNISEFCKLSNNRIDAKYRLLAVGQDGTETELVMGTSATQPGDFYAGMGKIAFFTPQAKVCVELTSKSYGFVVKSRPFAVGAEMTAVTQVEDDSATLQLGAQPGRLVMRADRPVPVTVYNIAGKRVWNGVVSGSASVELTKGIYLVNGKKVIL